MHRELVRHNFLDLCEFIIIFALYGIIAPFATFRSSSVSHVPSRLFWFFAQEMKTAIAEYAEQSGEFVSLSYFFISRRIFVANVNV